MLSLFSRTSGLVAVSSLVAVNGMKLYWTASLRKDPLYHTVHHGTTSEAVGQFGGGLEFRVTPHIGWMNDFSWNVINGPQNNFGMVRSGLTFAF